MKDEIAVAATPICRTCARNRLMIVVLAGKTREQWWCPCGVVGAQARTECAYYVRETGADDV